MDRHDVGMLQPAEHRRLLHKAPRLLAAGLGIEHDFHRDGAAEFAVLALQNRAHAALGDLFAEDKGH